MIGRTAMFVSMLLLGGLAWSGLTVGLIAYAVLHPPRMNDGKALLRLRRLSPADLGLAYEDVQFDLLDAAAIGRRIGIAGWWIPSASFSSRTAVLIHGYADAKVGGITWAPVLRACGFNVLAIDLRAHGDSGGRLSTAGFFERLDVGGVVDEVRQSRPAETRQLVLFGASMGAAVAAAVAVGRVDIAAVVLDSPYADFRQALTVRATRRGLPGGVFVEAGAWLAERWSGAQFTDVRPIDLVARVRCPMLVILPTDDPLIDDSDRAAMCRAVLGIAGAATPREVYSVPGAGHLLALAADPAEYARRLGAFLNTALLAAAECVHA